MLDLLVRGGRVLDGTGAPAHLADVAVASGRIVEVGRLTGARAAIEIDATGRYVTPGFIDAHVHADAAVLDPAMQEAALRQGVTTVVLGQDGLSFAPAGPATLDFVTRYFAAVNGAHPGLAPGRVSVAELLATYDRTTALNTAYLVPHGTVRHSVLGGARRAPTADELAAMLRLVEQGPGRGRRRVVHRAGVPARSVRLGGRAGRAVRAGGGPRAAVRHPHARVRRRRRGRDDRGLCRRPAQWRRSARLAPPRARRQPRRHGGQRPRPAGWT